MYPDLYLMRHGQTEWNLSGRMQGCLDSPLTRLGIEQARRQRELTGALEGHRIASPQGRAQQTAGIVFGNGGFATDDRLREIDIGDFTGRRIEQLRVEQPDIFAGGRLDWYDRAPGGEHFAALARRASGFLDSLTGPALIVTHGITLRMLRILAMGWPLTRLGELTVEQGAVHVVRKAVHEVWR